MLASSEQRWQAALPMSSGVEKRPSGIVARNFARISGVSSPMKVLSSGVSPAAGLMALTRTPSVACSLVFVLVVVFFLFFLALFLLWRGRGLTAAVEATLRMEPRLFALKCGTR